MTHRLGLLFCALVAPFCIAAWADSISPATEAPFTINLAGLGGGAVSGVTIASGLNYPYGMAVTASGNVLFGQSNPSTAGGIEGGPSTGSVSSITPLGNGTYSAPAQLVGGFSGPAQSVSVLNTPQGQDLVVDSGASSGRTITIYNAANAQIGQIQFTYASGYEHNTGVDTVLPLANGSYELVFGIGAEADVTATPPSQVSISGLGLSTTPVNGDSVYELTIQASGSSAQAVSGPLQIVAGVRNAYGLQFDSSGDLIVGDNGQDGAHMPYEIGADTLNIVPASEIGITVPDFGFPNSYTDFLTGQRINGDPNATGPLAAFTPTDDSNGVLQYSEGISAMACVGPDQMWFVGSEGGCFIGFHGTKNASGSGNPDDAFLYYDFASGLYTPIIDGGTNGVGHLDSIAVSGSTLFIGDMSTEGDVDGPDGGDSGAIYEFDFQAPAAPEPATWGMVLGSLVLVWWKTRPKAKRAPAATQTLNS
jgi:hypothetical protein